MWPFELGYIIFYEIFNKFAAAKARKLCLWSWIIASKVLQAFSDKLLLVRKALPIENFLATVLDLCNVDYAGQIAVLTTKYEYVQHKYTKLE